MEHISSIKDLATVLSFMCNYEDDCPFITVRIHCPFTEEDNVCPVWQAEKEITAEDWENVIRNLLLEKK